MVPQYTPRPAARRRFGHLLACLVVSAYLPLLRAQPATDTILIAADEETLWLLHVTNDRTLVWARAVNGPFEPQPELRAPVTRAAAARGALHVFVADGSHYTLTDARWLRSPDLRGRVLPRALAGGDGELYALIPAPAPADYPRLSDAAAPATSQPFDPGDTVFSIVQYDSRGWLAVTPAPRELTTTVANDAPPPQVYVHATPDGRALYVLWQHGPILKCHLLPPGGADWQPAALPADLPSVEAAWLVTANRLPTLVVVSRAASATANLRALRLMRPPGSTAPTWNTVPIELSDWSGDGPPLAYLTAGGFNQHVALLTIDARNAPFLRFMRVGGPAAEPTQPVTALLTRRPGGAAGPHLIQTAAWALLLGILAALVFFRRGALVQTLPLAAEWAPAFTFQRLLGCLIDIAPFALVSAALLKVDAFHSTRQLSDWSWTQRGTSPAPLTTLWWWLLTTGASTLYCLVIELVTRRTLGKLITGTYVLSESGAPASPLQIVVRNVLRFVELQPPLFWLLGFLVILSRNRQRAGDMFAHTVVVRRARPPTQDGEGG